MADRSPLLFVLLMSFSHFVHASSKTYIVQVNTKLKPSVFTEAKHWYEATLQTLRNENSADTSTTDHDPKPTTNVLTHVYNTAFHGFSTQLTPKQALMLSNQQGVIAVIPDGVQNIQTTRTPSFLGLYSGNNNNYDYIVPGHLLNRSDSGSNVTIRFLDTGIFPEHLSFRAQGLGAIPSKWKGDCEVGQNFSKANCNRKLIGARFFSKGYEALAGKGQLSPVGVAPKARIAVYKVCWVNGYCTDSDILSGIDKAVEDGVDIISCSIGSSYAMSLDLDVIAIGAFGAMGKGCFFLGFSRQRRSMLGVDVGG